MIEIGAFHSGRSKSRRRPDKGRHEHPTRRSSNLAPGERFRSDGGRRARATCDPELPGGRRLRGRCGLPPRGPDRVDARRSSGGAHLHQRPEAELRARRGERRRRRIHLANRGLSRRHGFARERRRGSRRRAELELDRQLRGARRGGRPHGRGSEAGSGREARAPELGSNLARPAGPGDPRRSDRPGAPASGSIASTTRASASTRSGSRRTTCASSSTTPRSAPFRPTTGSSPRTIRRAAARVASRSST